MSDFPLGLQGRPFPYDVDTTADHWWPKGLQRLWAAPNGYVSRIRPSGEVDIKKPPPKGSKKKGFGQKRGGHRVYFGSSPWNHTFEPEFDEVDNAGPPILKLMEKQLRGKDQGLLDPSAIARTTDTLIKLCFSLMVRSPAFRYRYSHAGKSFGFSYNEEAGKANIAHFWGLSRRIDLKKCNSGKLLLLHSENAEFCFGDGICDTLFMRPVSWRILENDWIADLSGDAFIPLLPNICAYLYFERNGCGSNTQVLQVTSNIVAEVNALTQVYAKEQLFFRAQTPSLTPEYKRCEHMILAGGKIPLIADLRARIR